MDETGLIGVILAGGKGSRMYPFSEQYPKCILPICNKPLMQYQIEMMREVGIRDIIILIGHYGFEVVRLLGNGEQLGVNIQYVEQGETLGIAHALGKLERHINAPFLLFLGDIFFLTDSLTPMLEAFAEDDTMAVLATKTESDPDAIKRNFAVIRNEQGFVKRVIEKPRHPTTNLKGCGLYLFDLQIFDAVRRTPRTAMRDEYEITDSIQILLNDGFNVKAANLIEDDLNLTFPDDLLHINLTELSRSGRSELVGSDVAIADQHRIERSVVGDNATISGEFRITNSLIFPNAEVTLTRDIDNTIITRDKQISCFNRPTEEEDPS